jgi:hypothetical protein
LRQRRGCGDVFALPLCFDRLTRSGLDRSRKTENGGKRANRARDDSELCAAS